MRKLLWIPLCATLVACDSPAPSGSRVPEAGSPAFHLRLTVRQLMDWLIDPNADVLWGAVGTIITEQGREELMPKSEEDWAAVRNSAAVLVESANLLMMEGRAFDRGEWITAAQAFSAAAVIALQAAEAKDVEALFDAGGTVYEACVECHTKYALSTPASE